MLVVDDDPKVRLLLERAFRAPEFETHTFATGAAALEQAASIRPDCVVSDILMPDMDGEGLLRALRATPGLDRVPFVAVSAVRSESRIQSVLDAGASAFLLKPFPLRDLLDKVRSLLDRPAPAKAPPAKAAAERATEKTSDYTSPTRPVYAAAHTTSTTALPRRGRAAQAKAAEATPAPPVVRVLAPVRVVLPAPAAAPAAPEAVPDAPRRTELAPPDDLGFGRFTKVEARGRSFVVLTEAVAKPRFTVTTVVSEGGGPLRKVETALPHPLAREEDRATVRRQLDAQHDDVLARLDHFVLDHTPRRVVWSDQSRSVDAGLLSWTMSAVAQLAEAEIGTEEATRLLRQAQERARLDEDSLRAFHVTPLGRVVLDPDHPSRLPRRAVRAVAAWCHAFATVALQADAGRVAEPVRQATRRHAAELEGLGFYERLQRRVKA
jgi:CheY-like chemotaxis protein